MRIKTGSTMEEARRSLDPRQRIALATVVRKRQVEQHALTTYEEKASVLRQGVAEALRAGVPARLIADRLGITMSRVYQMRDEGTT